MLPEFRYFSKNFRIKIANIAKSLFIISLSYLLILNIIRLGKIQSGSLFT